MTNPVQVNAVLLCGGFGTRLERDLKSNSTKDSPYGLPPFQQLVGVPKGLLPVGRQDRLLLDYWLLMIQDTLRNNNDNVSLSNCVYLVCNGLHHKQFLAWAEAAKTQFKDLEIKITCNGIERNEERNGSVVDLQKALETFGLLSSHVLVIAGDTLLTKFTLGPFLGQAASALSSNATSSAILVHYPISDEETLKSGVLQINQESGQCVGFLEKPGPTGTVSRLGCPCFYLLTPQAIASLDVFLELKRGLGLDAIDASGRWVQWIVNDTKDHGQVFSLSVNGRLDIGGLASYLEAHEYVQQNML